MGHVSAIEPQPQPQLGSISTSIYMFFIPITLILICLLIGKLTIQAYSVWLFMSLPSSTPSPPPAAFSANCHGKWAAVVAVAALYANQRFALMSVLTHTHSYYIIDLSRCVCVSKYEQSFNLCHTAALSTITTICQPYELFMSVINSATL